MPPIPDQAAPEPLPRPPQDPPISALHQMGKQLQTARFWLLAFMVGTAAYIGFIVRPIQGPPPAMEGSDVSEAWNKGVERLGIQALYPLQEDFRVGDVWAIVAESKGKPLLGKSVRLARIDLKNYIIDGDLGRPIFGDTSDPPSAQTPRKIGRLEADVAETESRKIAAAIAAFPAITVRNSVSSNGAAALGWFGLGGGRQGQQYEQIQIRSVETYGAPSLEAYGALQAWCKDRNTAVYCENDELARRLLAVAVSPDVLETDENGYTNRIELRLITRVFMTREIATKRWVLDGSGAAIEINSDGKATLPVIPAGPPPVAGPTLPANPQPAPVPPPASPQSASGAAAKASAQWSSESEIGLNGVFLRPVVFGFRSIRHELPLSESKTKKPATAQSTSNQGGK